MSTVTHAAEPDLSKSWKLAGARKLTGFFRIVSAHPVQACADQAIISGTSFLTLVLVARWSDPEQLGCFAIVVSILGILLTLQQSLVSLPYTILRHDNDETTNDRLSATYFLSAGVSLAAAFLALIAAIAASIFEAPAAATKAAWMLVWIVPAMLVRELIREIALAHMNILRALWIDASASAIQLCFLLWVGLSGRMSLVAACASFGLSSGIVVMSWGYLNRDSISSHPQSILRIAGKSWTIGKWLSLSKSALLVQGYSLHWISLAIGGAILTGIYAACMSVASLANPLLFGLYNLLTPRAVLAWREGGAAALLGRAARDAALLGILMSAFFLVTLWFGKDILELLYPGTIYVAHADIVAILAASAIFAAIGTPAATALAAIGRGRPVAFTTGVTAALTVALVSLSMIGWGLPGAAYCLVIANVVSMFARWLVLLFCVRTQPDVIGSCRA